MTSVAALCLLKPLWWWEDFNCQMVQKAANYMKWAIISKSFSTSMCFQQKLHPKAFQESKKLQCKRSFLTTTARSCCDFAGKLVQRGSRLTEGWKALLKAVLAAATSSLLCNSVSPWNKLWRFCKALTCILKGMVVCCGGCSFLIFKWDG